MANCTAWTWSAENVFSISTSWYGTFCQCRRHWFMCSRLSELTDVEWSRHLPGYIPPVYRKYPNPFKNNSLQEPAVHDCLYARVKSCIKTFANIPLSHQTSFILYRLKKPASTPVYSLHWKTYWDWKLKTGPLNQVDLYSVELLDIFTECFNFALQFRQVFIICRLLCK